MRPHLDSRTAALDKTMWHNILSCIFPCRNWHKSEPLVRAQSVGDTLTVEIVIDTPPEEQLQQIPVPLHPLPRIEDEPAPQSIWRKLMVL